MNNPKSEIRNPNQAQSPKPETGAAAARPILECGGQRSAPPLSLLAHHAAVAGTKRRPRCALPAHSTRCAFLCLLLLVACCGAFTTFAQSFSIPWHTIDGGGSTSTGGVYSVSGTIGQPDAGGPMTGGQFSLTGGFWALPQAVQTEGAPTLTISPASPGLATISWTPATGTNWILQERLSLTAGAWTNSPSGATNPVVVPVTLPTRFYRLFRP